MTAFDVDDLMELMKPTRAEKELALRRDADVTPMREGRLDLVALNTVTPRQVRWLKPGLIPLRTLTLVAGVGGLGKSTWLAGITAETSRGDLLDSTPGAVVLVSFEDAVDEGLRPRVEAAQGDLTLVHAIVSRDLDGIDPVQLPRDVDELELRVRDVNARLVVIDPVVAAIDVSLDAHKDQHVRSVLARLARMAVRTECAVALVGHLNKTPSRDAYVRVANSVAFWNASRSVVLITEDPEDPDTHRLVVQRKANYSRLQPVERHRIDEVQLGSIDVVTGDYVVTSRMTFVEHADDVDGADVLAVRDSSTDRASRPARRFLGEVLGNGEWHESAGLKKLAAASGIAERTLQRAADDLGVEHERRGFPASTWWKLPQSGRVLSHMDGATDAYDANPHGSTGSDVDETTAPSVPPRTGTGVMRDGTDGRPANVCDAGTSPALCVETGRCVDVERQADDDTKEA
jgi:hypothetical protein